MKKKLQILKISIFMGVLILPSLLWYGLRLLAPGTYAELDYDLGEKTQVELPEKFDPRDYTRQLEAYYNDNVPFRSQMISLQQKLAGILERGYTGYLRDGLARLFYGREAEGFFAPQIVGDIVLLGRHDWLFYAGDDSISYYRGTNLLEEEQMEFNMSLMVQLQELCDAKGIRLQFIILPNKELVYDQYMPSYAIENNTRRTEVFVDYVKQHSDIHIVYPLQELRQAGEHWQTYHRYDTHWNHAGAFIGTQELYRALDMPTTDLSSLEVTQCDATTSDLMILGGLDASQYPAEYDYAINYRPEVTLTNVSGDKQPSGIYFAESDCGNDKNLVFIGDSFRCFMIDYLTKDFSSSIITYRETSDNRTDYPEEVVRGIQSADILVVEAVDRYDSRLYPAIQKLIEILQAETD